ncbi:MAG: hypothetical protein ABJK37_16045 [Paraglaciecola sp.]|uniref:hypothetical protein n=1 Tax=Paraglaciecola sp. TaxID=1920173 RepID=UPI00329A09F5
MSIFDYEGKGEGDEATFFSLSGEYLEAAITLNNTPPTTVNYWIVTYYLLGHAAELSLKSYLFKHELKTGDLKKIGHDLSELLNKAKEYSPKDFELKAIHELSHIYKGKDLEYRCKKKQTFPAVDMLIDEVKKLQSIVFNEVVEF